MNKELQKTNIPLKEYGVQAAFYVQESGEVKYQTTDKGVKLFVESPEFPGRRINFWMPKVALHFSDGCYTHVRYACISMLRSNIGIATAKAISKWRNENVQTERRIGA